MPLSAAEQRQLEELTRKQNEVDPDDDMEVCIEIEGKKIYIPYKKAKPWMKKQGLDLDEILEEAGEGVEGEEEEEEEGEEGEELEEGLAGSPRPKGSRKAPAKKAPVEGEPPAELRGRSYWKRPA